MTKAEIPKSEMRNGESKTRARSLNQDRTKRLVWPNNDGEQSGQRIGSLKAKNHYLKARVKNIGFVGLGTEQP